MRKAEATKFWGWEDGTHVLLSKWEWDGTPAVQADYGTITYKVFDIGEDAKGTPEEVAGVGGSITVADAIFDTLQTSTDDERWPFDDEGFNFLFVLPVASFPAGDRWYRVEVKHVHSDGSVQWDPFEGYIRAIYTS